MLHLTQDIYVWFWELFRINDIYLSWIIVIVLTMLNFIWALCSWKVAIVGTLPPYSFVFQGMANYKWLPCCHLFLVKTDLPPSSMTPLFICLYKTLAPLPFLEMALINRSSPYYNSPNETISLIVRCWLWVWDQNYGWNVILKRKFSFCLTRKAVH